ncbi:Ap-3 Complex Subunit Delta-1 [Manis pentadactyla]|nr:Ap-3 Complex Subunit Delta-1 [Manis pentadactyla]
MPRGTAEQWRLMELCTPTPSRVRLASSADSRLPFSDEPPSGPHRDLLPRFSFHCLRVMGSPQITVDPETPHKKILILLQHVSAPMPGDREQWPLDGTLHPDTLTRALHLFCRQPSRSGDTPQENTDSSATRLGPHANGDREQWPLDGTLPRHPHACGFTSSADSRGPPAVCSSYHALGLYPLSLVLGRSSGQETPHKKILILLYTFPGLMPTAGPGVKKPLDGTLHPNTSLGAASPSLQTADFRWMSLPGPPQRSSARFSFHCLRVLGIARSRGYQQSVPATVALGLYPLSLVLGRSGDTPQENTDLLQHCLGSHANEGTGSSGRLMELCTPTPSRVRLHLFW